MSTKRLWIVIGLVTLISMVLAACGTTPTPEVIEKTVVVTQEVVKTVEVTAEPTPAAVVDRQGGWLDTIVVIEEPNSQAAVSRLDVGDLDAFIFAVGDAELFKQVQGMKNLEYNQAAGGSDELTFNPVGPTFPGTGKLNPFSVPAIREAMQWMIDRNYIGQEIMGGLGKPRFFPIVGGFPDYARYVDKCRELEAKYAYNPEKGKEIITAEMEKLGATLVNGKWQYNNEPVELIFLIRTEDERREIGDYISNQLESIGFTVRRDYKTSAEASPIWMRGNPNDGLWHLYTGGWITTVVARDQASNFDYYYTPRGRTQALWQNYTPTEEFNTVADRLNRNDFKTMEERDGLFRRALELALQDSVRIWLVDEYSFSPYRQGIEVAADLAGGISGAWLLPFTLRWSDQIGGSMTVANSSILTESWNPVAGTNWIYDMTWNRATADRDLMPDPFTGLAWPQRIERAEVTIEEGLPVVKTLDWVDLKFAPQIEVPADAWADWDAAAQKFITAGEKFTETAPTAKAKIVVYYPENLYDIKWHDGSQFSLADIVYSWINGMDTAKEASAIYDASTVPTTESFLTSFKGYRIVQEDPLIIEYYTDQYFLEAELCLYNLPLPGPFFPYYLQGPGAWHNVAVGALAEANKELAFTSSKADELEVDWMNYIGGPSLEILKKYLDQATAENYIPYSPTLSAYITPEEAQARWANLQEWYRRRGHFWIGTGAYYLEKAFPVEGTLILKHNPDYIDPAGKWDRFGEPKFAAAEIDGPGRLSAGTEGAYDVYVTFKDTPYPQDEIKEVRYLVFGAKGALAFTGVGEAAEDGLWKIKFPAEEVAKLEAGSNRLEVIVVSKLVSIPTFASFEFITAP